MRLGVKQPTRSTRCVGAALHELDLQALAERAVDDAHEDHHAEIGIVPAVDDHRACSGASRLPVGGGMRRDDGFEHFGDAEPRLRAGEDRVGGVDADDVFDLVADLFRLGGGEVDLVDHGHDLVVVLDRLVDVGERLRLDPLRGVDHEQSTFARGKAARNLVCEVHVAGGIH